MKKSLFFILLLGALVSYGIFNKAQVNSELSEANQNTAFQEKWNNKATKFEAYAKWRNELLANVETGEVNPQDYYNAIRKADEFKSKNANKTSGALNLEWVNRGPDSQAGRSRAFLFDNTDSKLLYTGGISGGLYNSIDGGENWERVAGYNGNNASIMSLGQSIDGILFVGTGESLAGGAPNGSSHNTSITGDGMYRSSDGGDTWSQISETNVNSIIETGGEIIPSYSGEWASVNAIANHPTDATIMLVGNRSGLRITTNATATDPNFSNVSGASGIVTAIEITSDGQDAWAGVGGRVYKSTTGSFTTFSAPATLISSSRVQIAVSTVDSDGDYVVYASFTNGSGCLVGIYKSEDKGTSWSQIVFPGGLDPFSQPTDPASCQGWYDHCIAVNPVDKDKIYIGGITFYTWGAGAGGLKRADQIDTEGASSLDPNYIHADKHFIKFSKHDATGNTMFICGDGGINRCLNANSGFPDNMVYTENNKNLITLQCLSVGSGKYGEVMAGAQDNGTQYVDLLGISAKAAKEPSGGDGVAGAEISNLSPGILFSGVYDGQILRSLNNGNSSTSFVDGNIDPANCGYITCAALTNSQTCDDINAGADFVYPFLLMEIHDRMTIRQDIYVYARDEQIVLPGGATQDIKDTIYPGNVTDQVVIDAIPGLDLHGLDETFELTTTLYPGDTMFFDNKFDAKYFVPTTCGELFVCTNPLQEGASPVFTGLNIPLESGIKRMDYSYDGDLVAGVSGANVVIMQGWDSYVTGTNPGTVSTRTVNLSGIGATSLEGISVNKNNKDHILVTEAGYGSASKVFVTFDATSINPTFTNIHTSTLPEMPIFSCVIDKANPLRYILGTELGIWASNDGGLTWEEENEGMGGRFPVYALRQNWMNNFDCDILAIGTLGAGMYTSSSLMDCANKDNLIWGKPDLTDIPKVANLDLNSVAVYPNPVQDIANISFYLSKTATVSVKIIDLTGKVVSKKTFNNLDSGDNVLRYDISDIAASSYYAVVSTDGMSYQNRLFTKK